MYKFKKNQLLVALTGWTPYTPCLVIADNKDDIWIYCYSVGFRTNKHIKGPGLTPVRLCFTEDELRIAILNDIINNPFIYKSYRPIIKDFLKSLI